MTDVLLTAASHEFEPSSGSYPPVSLQRCSLAAYSHVSLAAKQAALACVSALLISQNPRLAGAFPEAEAAAPICGVLCAFPAI